ncbi:hypothetical protein [Flavobacterium branchiicola]|uniref:Lipoprotein n=1 Tax=Flavobacterium branchiicola TaxID=1114875 RepID=A0ABV9PL69_9FLAO|nr:hypothetical protein [Flavobacterium branchiicola]MBS7256699.1 hypothetical protein [Flavobacterium branchiicola]
MKIHTLFFLLLLIGCQKPKPAESAAKKTVSEKHKVANVADPFISSDTIHFYAEGETSSTNYILANLVDQKVDKDSIVISRYQLDFYENKTKTASSKVTINGYEKGSEWSATYGLSSESTNTSSFIQVSFGYPACGYNQSHYLYHLKNKNLQLVYEWDSMTDSGWGSWVEFDNPTAKNDPETFYCKRVAFEPEEDDDNMGTVTHSDSIEFRLSGNHWKNQLLSVQEKVYYQKKVSFDDFYKQK